MTEVVICRTDDNRLDVTVHSVLSNTLRDAQNLC